MTTSKLPELPVLVHALHAMTVSIPSAMGDGKVLACGEEFEISEDFRAANTNRNGESWCDLLDDEPGQITTFGHVMFRRGPWPDDVPPYEPGSPDWEMAFRRESAEAHRASVGSERVAALKRVEDRFGGVPATSRTMATYGSPGA